MRYKKEPFLVDVDGVLLSFSGGFVPWVKKNYSDLDLDLSKYDFGLDSDTHLKLVETFNQSEEFGQLEPWKDAQKYLLKLHEDFSMSLIAITSCIPTYDYNFITASSVIQTRRVENLKNVFGDIFSEVLCVQMHGSKAKYLERFPNSFYVEDSIKHCIEAKKYGITPFLMSHSANVNIDAKEHDVTRIENWKEFYNLMTKEEAKRPHIQVHEISGTDMGGMLKQIFEDIEKHMGDKNDD